jgi:hypothetical protein
MKDFLFELAMSYKIMNPIRGIVPGSPLSEQPNLGKDHEIDHQLYNANSQWQKEASSYVKECITPDSRYKLEKFMDDEKLNKIRLDKTLFHIPKSQGSYINSRTGRLTLCGNKAKEKMCNIQVPSKEGEDATELTAKKIRKCPPKCILCCAMANPKGKEYKKHRQQSTVQCVL